MEQPLYSSLKVCNEIELCEIADLDCKKLIEHELLKEHISFYIRWPKPSLFGRKKSTCIICVNENVQELAEEIVHAVCDENGYQVKFLKRRFQNQYL